VTVPSCAAHGRRHACYYTMESLLTTNSLARRSLPRIRRGRQAIKLRPLGALCAFARTLLIRILAPASLENAEIAEFLCRQAATAHIAGIMGPSRNRDHCIFLFFSALSASTRYAWQALRETSDPDCPHPTVHTLHLLHSRGPLPCSGQATSAKPQEAAKECRLHSQKVVA